MKNGIRHMVIFTLKNDIPITAQKFLSDGEEILSNIPGVNEFEVLQQISIKNPYKYGFSMFFEDNQAYQGYNQHDKHTNFVKEYWFQYVDTFLEIDFASI